MIYFVPMRSISSGLLSDLCPTITPPSMKMIVYATNTYTFQIWFTLYLASVGNFVRPNAAIYKPIETRAIIPLTWIPIFTYYATK